MNTAIMPQSSMHCRGRMTCLDGKLKGDLRGASGSPRFMLHTREMYVRPVSRPLVACTVYVSVKRTRSSIRPGHINRKKQNDKSISLPAIPVLCSLSSLFALSSIPRPCPLSSSWANTHATFLSHRRHEPACPVLPLISISFTTLW